MNEPGKVYLVGAGCGTADLITVRGLELLRACDAVIYDDLIDITLLEEVPREAEKIYMGKRQGRPSAAQEEICALLVEKARAGKTVVRLKGGDPFVFGRGGEEMLALREAGVPCEVVPGVTSAIAIPAMAGIPVTHRGLSRSVHIVTAHTADTGDGLPDFLDDLARLPGTLVFLMGLTQLSELARRLTAAGMPPSTPAAVLSGGNAPHPVTVRGTLADIAGRADAARVRPPAVILVGETAGLDLSLSAPLPLRDIRVGLTGSRAMAEKLRAALEPLGARTFLAQRSLVRELPLSSGLGALCDGTPRWLVFTGPNGVEEFFRRLRAKKVDLRGLGACRFAVIGAATGEALEGHGFTADLCPETYTTAALARALLAKTAPGEEIILLRSRLGSKELFQTLSASRRVTDLHLYDVVSDPLVAKEAGERLAGTDYLTFSSAGGVEMFLADQGAVPDGAVCVCIGEVTAAALRPRYGGPILLAPETSAEGIAAAILAREASGGPGAPTRPYGIQGTP